MEYHRIKKAAEMRGISLVDLASEVGITEQGLHRIFREEKTTVDTLEKIALALKVPINYFFGGDLTEVKSTKIKERRARVVFDLESDDLLYIDMKTKKLEIVKK